MNNFEEWFGEKLDNLTPNTAEKLEKYKPEFKRVWNIAVEECIKVAMKHNRKSIDVVESEMDKLKTYND